MERGETRAPAWRGSGQGGRGSGRATKSTRMRPPITLIARMSKTIASFSSVAFGEIRGQKTLHSQKAGHRNETTDYTDNADEQDHCKFLIRGIR